MQCNQYNVFSVFMVQFGKNNKTPGSIYNFNLEIQKGYDFASPAITNRTRWNSKININGQNSIKNVIAVCRESKLFTDRGSRARYNSLQLVTQRAKQELYRELLPIQGEYQNPNQVHVTKAEGGKRGIGYHLISSSGRPFLGLAGPWALHSWYYGPVTVCCFSVMKVEQLAVWSNPEVAGHGVGS